MRHSDVPAADSSDEPAVDSGTESARVPSAKVIEQLRLLGEAVRHVRKVQGVGSRVSVLATTVPRIAHEQASEADDHVNQALRCLEALENLLKEGP